MKSNTLAIITIFLFTFLLTAATTTGYERDQAVTWSNFNYIRSVATSMSSTYFATTNGVIHYDKSRDEWMEPLTGTEGIDHRDIRRIWVDLFDEQVYAQTSEGLYEYQVFFGQWYPIGSLPQLNNDNKHLNSLPLLYPPFGYNYDPEGRLIDASGRYYNLTDVVDDGSGRLWIGTWGYGPAVAGSAAAVIELLPYGLIQERVDAILPVGDKLLVGGDVFDDPRTGLTLFDPDNLKFEYLESGLDPTFPATDVNCLELSDRYFYAGTPYGLFLIDRSNRRVDRHYTTRSGLSDDVVYSLANGGDRLFIGTDRGLDVLTETEDSLLIVHPGHLSNLPVRDLEVVDSTVWLATDDGAYRYFPKTNKLQRAADPKRLLATRITLIDHNADDLWFGTRDGLVRLDTKTGDVENILVGALGGDEIQAIAVNDKVILAGTWRGMTMINYTDAHRSNRRFTTGDGLPADDINVLLLDGDFVWIGTDRGLTRFWWNNPNRVD